MAKKRNAPVASAPVDDDIDNDNDQNDEEAEASSDEEGGGSGKRGRRQVYVVCSAFSESLPEAIKDRGLDAGDSGLAFEMVPLEMSDSEEVTAKDFEVAREAAIQKFADKFGVEASDVVASVPMYIRKGIGGAATRKRETVNKSVAKRAPFTAKRGTCVYTANGIDWECLVNFTTDPNIIWILPEKPVNPELKKKLEKETNKKIQAPFSGGHHVMRSAVTNIKENSE